MGIPDEDLELESEILVNAGAVYIVYASGGGLTSIGDQSWHEGELGVDAAENHDRFGYALAAIPSVRPKIYRPLVL